jgi:hypothetical protein
MAGETSEKCLDEWGWGDYIERSPQEEEFKS